VTRRPGDLPPELAKAAFTVAQGKAWGLSAERIRGNDLDRPFRGVRRSIAGRPDDAGERHDRAAAELLDRCAALELVLPDEAFFSHITAARLWPLPVPAAEPGESLHVGVGPPHHPPRRPGVIGHQITDPRSGVLVRHGHRLIDPASLFCQLSVVLRVDDLVAVGDALVHLPRFSDVYDERPWVTMTELNQRVELFRGRGKVSAAKALALIRSGAESRPETLVRLAIGRAGLPEPEVNVEVVAADGTSLGFADLLYRRERLIVEYDGDQHRVSTAQFDQDVRRLDAFAANGWRVVRITSREFFGDRFGCIARIQQALLAGGRQFPR
jgi:hypothetical protein